MQKLWKGSYSKEEELRTYLSIISQGDFDFFYSYVKRTRKDIITIYDGLEFKRSYVYKLLKDEKLNREASGV